jgi:predicted HTH transcriptional regulator
VIFYRPNSEVSPVGTAVSSDTQDGTINRIAVSADLHNGTINVTFGSFYPNSDTINSPLESSATHNDTLESSEPQNSAVNDTVSSSDLHNGTINIAGLSKHEQSLVNVIRKNPRSTVDELINAIGKSRRSVLRYLSSLKEKKILQRVGSKKTGFWKITR